MPKTLVYEDYETDRFDQAEYPVVGTRVAARTIAGISPFTVPDGVQAEVNENGDCRFVFSYPDSEQPAKKLWKWLDDTDVEVRIGAHSQRIMQLYVKNAAVRLAAGPLRLDARAAWSWCREAPSRIRNSAVRNTEVVAQIMATVPDSLRLAILQAIRERR